MPFAPNFPRGGKIYITAVIGLGFLAIAESLVQLYRVPLGANGLQWILLAILTLISGSASVELPRANVSISISEAFVFTAVLLYGPAAGTLTVALDGLVISFWVARRRPELHRALFNISAPAFSAWCSAHVFFRIAGVAPLSQQSATPIVDILPALLVFAIVYFALNSSLIALVIGFQRNLNPFVVWRTSLVWLSLNYFCGASVAMLLVGYNRTIDLKLVGVVVPLLLVLYFTFKTSTQRVEDANKHLEELNSLYLSTIETLAMAVDAKDQVTHGHIRRVQAYAIGLAAHVGVRDSNLIKAIEAAALLHDMGKLAVPEYVLNKPGKLTDTEFEKMKAHASIGADILSAIDFPYPVVPIVRHHHENWNGTGYPAGLKGTEIPIGARILSVVDCFDALTSDRPYRPRLSDHEALQILTDRRGTMYDPLIVDTFARVYRLIAPNDLPIGVSRHTLDEIASARKTIIVQPNAPVLEEIAASSDEMSTMYELTQSLAGQASVSDIGDVIAQHLRRLIPSSLTAFYLYDAATNEVEARHVVGDGSAIVRGTRIQMGQRLSGWVAAHRQTIMNSDPVLDLGDAARAHSLSLKSCLSSPVIAGDDLVGVLTLYSTNANAFVENHRRIVGIVASTIAHALRRSAESNRASRASTTRLPDSGQLEQLILRANDGGEHYALLFIDLIAIESTTTQQGGTTELRHVSENIRSVLPVADTLFLRSDSQFVAFLNGADIERANGVANKIVKRLSESSLLLQNGERLRADVTIAASCTQLGGKSLSELLSSAQRFPLAPSSPDTSIH